MYTTVLQPEPERWDVFVSQHPRSHFLQISAWGDFKTDFGWMPQRVALADSSGKLVAGAQILYRALPFRLGKLAYIPFGPVVDWGNTSLVKALFKVLDRTARQSGAVFMKLEPGYDVSGETLKAMGCRLSPQTVQPPRTLILDIRNEETALQAMNQGTRRNIRKSEKFEIEVRQGSREDVASFNQLLQTTSQRQGFGVHVSAYYEGIYDRFIAHQATPIKANLLMASYPAEDGTRRDLSGVVVFVLGQQAWYLYGASSDEERQRMASFGVQWAAIQWARQQGAKRYDMYGVPDRDPMTLEALFEQEHEGLWGVYRFKRGWGGQVVRTVGAWDRVYQPPLYWAYRAYLTFRGDEE